MGPDVTLRSVVSCVVYFVLPYLSVLAFRRRWTDIALLDQWCDVITVVIMIAYTAIMIRILVRRGEIVVFTRRLRSWWIFTYYSWEYFRTTIRKGDNSFAFWSLVAMYPIMCTVATFFVLIPRMIGRN